MKISYTLILILLLQFSPGASLNAQNTNQPTDSTFLLKGNITNAETNQSLEGVNVFSLTSLKGTSTNENGDFELKISTLPCQIQFSFIGFETQAVWIEKSGDQWLDLKLHPYMSTLPDVVISAQPKIEEITHKTYTVRDFVFYENDILILTYPGMKDGHYLVLIDIDGRAKDSLSIKGIKRIDFMTKSCLGNVHLVTDDKDYQIEIGKEGIKIVDETSRQMYSRFLEPCVAATDRHLFYMFRFLLGQYVKFEGYDKESDLQFTISEVANGENLERRYWEEIAPKLGFIDGMDVSWEEKGLEVQRVLEGDIQLASTVSLFYPPIYVPMINIGSQLCIFNHINNVIELYDTNGAFQRKVPINYHKIEKWDTRIMHDAFTGKVYTTYDHPKGKVIRAIDLENGTLGVPTLIDCVYIEQMKVRDGVLYYLESGTTLSEVNRVLHKVKL